MNDIKISELEETDYLQGGCYFPLVQENETKKVSFETLKNELPQTEVMVGTTTTGEPGTDASVFNSGTPTAPILNFTIPKGDPGEQGKQGIQGPRGFKGDTAHDIYVGDKSAAPSEAKLIIEPVKGTATGTDIQVTDSVNDRVSKLALDGRSTQETRSGKNKWNNDLVINVTKNDDGFTIKELWATNIMSLENILKTFKTNTKYTIKIVNKVISKPTTLSPQQTSATYDIALYESSPYILIPFNTYDKVNANVGDINTTYKTITTPSSFDNFKLLGYSFLGNNNGSTNYVGAGSIEIQQIMVVEGEYTESNFPEYEQYGASPSPDYPSEIESVEGKNLLPNNATSQTTNGVTFTVNDDKTIIANGTSTAITDLYMVGSANEYVDLGVPTGNYILNGCPVSGSTSNYMLYAVQKRGNKLSYYQDTGNGLTIPIESGDTFRIFIRILSGKEVVNALYKPMLSINGGNYIPYNWVEVKATGKNLANLTRPTFTNNGVTFTYNGDGTYTLNGTATVDMDNQLLTPENYFEVSSDKYYKISVTRFSGDGNLPANARLVIDGTSTWAWIQTGGAAKKPSANGTINLINAYISKDSKFINLRIGIQVEVVSSESSPATSWEQSQYNSVIANLKGNELCSLPNGTKDELIVKDGRAKIVKRIGKVVLDGSENWGQNVNLTKDNTSYYYTYALDNLVKGTDQLGTLISNYFINQNTYDTDNEGISLSTIIPFLRLRINTSTAPTLAEFKAWLQANPVTLQYVSETPEEIDIEVTGNLQTCEGTSNITNSEDTNMSVEYVTNKTNLYYKNNGNIIKMNN